MESSRRISVLAVLTAARLFTFGYHLPYSMYREQSQMRVAWHHTINQLKVSRCSEVGNRSHPCRDNLGCDTSTRAGLQFKVKGKNKTKLRGMVAIVHFLTCLLLNRINFTRFIINKQTHTSKKARYVNKGVITRKRKQRFVQYGHV